MLLPPLLRPSVSLNPIKNFPLQNNPRPLKNVKKIKVSKYVIIDLLVKRLY